MTSPSTPSVPLAQHRPQTPDPLTLETDVLVIGGGLSGCWAAAAAARAGARVVLADKGYCGTSGVTATAGPGHWWVPPEDREAAALSRYESSHRIGQTDWMQRIMDLTWQSLPELSRYYRFSTDDKGRVQYRALRGPEYMRAMRALITDLGVTILDHAPALELLAHTDGSIGGAAGVLRQKGGAPWRIRAGATVLATGGCAFLSRLLGSHTNTGDGLLMAAEAGASLSGMEFNTYYCVAPAHTTMTRSMVYAYATYSDASGRVLDIAPSPDPSLTLVKALIEGPVYAVLDRFPERFRQILPVVQPNTQTVFDRMRIDPYSQRFEVTLHGEGTVRGIGGLRIADRDCQTDVPGLFACGDAASRELVAGAVSGGGAINSAWALSSGQFAGAGAAQHARGARQGGALQALGQAGLRPNVTPTRTTDAIDPAQVIQLAQDHMLDLDRAFFRNGQKLSQSLGLIDTAWADVTDRLQGQGRGTLRAREAAAILVTARWCLTSGLARRESRGMHRRTDFPAIDPGQPHRLVLSGLLGPQTAPRISYDTNPDAIPQRPQDKARREGAPA